MNTNAKPLSVTIGSKGLDKTGPYIQNETPGMFGKSYSMPDKNPEDGSYMPQCGEGECLKTSRRRDGIMGDSATCEKRADPNSMPPNPTNPTGPKPKSCAIPDPNNSMFGEQKYYVYWDKLPENLESKKVASGRVIKRTGPYEIKPMPFLFGSTIATLPQKNPIDDSIMPPCGDDCASELWWYDSRKGRSSRNQLTKVCERYHTHPYKIDEIDMPDSNNQGYTSSTTKKLPKSCSKPIGHNEGIVMNPTHPEHYYVYWNQDPDTLLKSKKNIATSNVKARKSRRKIRN